jgi:hypothetical protein
MSIAYFLALAATAAPSAPPPQPDALAAQAMHNFGACVVDQTPEGARELLGMDYRSKPYEKKLKAMAQGHGRCAPNARLRFNGVLFAGALAEQLLKTDVKAADLPKRLAFDAARETIAARSSTETMALCTVLKAPDASIALFNTEPATHEEGEALHALVPVMTECLTKDMKVEANRPALRSILALAAWRIATTPVRAAQ